MAKTSSELEREFIANAAGLTGKSVLAWMEVIRSFAWGKRHEILEGLKKVHGLGHLHAQFLAGMFMNNGSPVYADPRSLLDAHFVNCPDMHPLMIALAKEVLSKYPEALLMAKKTYLSFTDVREFGAVNVKTRELRLGLDLGPAPFTDRLRRAVLTGPMPRFTHMVVLESAQDLDEQLHSLLTKSHERSHKK